MFIVLPPIYYVDHKSLSFNYSNTYSANFFKLTIITQSILWYYWYYIVIILYRVKLFIFCVVLKCLIEIRVTHTVQCMAVKHFIQTKVTLVSIRILRKITHLLSDCKWIQEI